MKQLIALVLAVLSAGSPAVIGGCGTEPDPQPDQGSSAYAIVETAYPKMAPYPDESAYYDPATGEFDDEGFSAAFDAWNASIQQQRQQDTAYLEGPKQFTRTAAAALLGQSDGQNHVCSPLNIYMALGMLAETTDGNSRQQILDLLDEASIESLRTTASALWNANYRDDGAVASILAASLWLNQSVAFKPETLNTIAETYYASSYRGEMGSAEFDQALQAWLNAQTGGLLEDQISDLSMEPETILALATTIYFRAKWSNEFSEHSTTQDVFHTPDSDLTCDFMHQSDARNYYWGDRFSSVAQPLENRGAMWFILPDEGVSVQELLTDSQTLDFLLANGDWENSKYLIVNLAVPKFDVTSQLDLSQTLKTLGVTDVFDPTISDFTPLTEETDGIYVSQAEHDARVTIDEQGCTAVAYTVMMAAGAGMPPEETVDFVLDRPFLFVITGSDGLPLFIGVVNQPV
ncbi:MAG: serpin family protein [Oscillospiraceae bacterium]|nr:serpin family protein [Oscillospiraceae bacterium]